MRIFIYPLTLILFSLLTVSCQGDDYGKTISQLEVILDQRQSSFERQEELIQIQEQLLQKSTDPRERFEICSNIFSLSRSYNYDIAYKYSHMMLELATEIGDANLICLAQANQISTFTSGGLFTQADRVEQSIEIQGVDSLVRRELYYNIVRYYSDQIDYINSELYRSKQLEGLRRYTDSIVALSASHDYYYAYAKCYREMSDSNFSQVIKDLTSFYGSRPISAHHNSIITYLLGNAHHQQGDMEQAFKYMTLSVGYDVEAAARENRSIKTISEYFFSVGQTKIAEKLIEIAFEDAKFYNARHRNLEVNALLPIINKHKINTISQQRNTLYALLVVISVLSVVAVVFGVIARRNARIANRSKGTIQEQLEQISQVNAQLVESHRIKEHYIIDSLYRSNEHLKQTETLLRKIDLKIKNRLFDDLRLIYRDFNIKREKGRFFENFDKTFLELFPNFIIQYNQLFRPEDQINIETSHELPPEVRIFALMRLGISDSEKISRFLDLSINTIYTYKTKVKSRTIVPKEEFENCILSIKL